MRQLYPTPVDLANTDRHVGGIYRQAAKTPRRKGRRDCIEFSTIIPLAFLASLRLGVRFLPPHPPPPRTARPTSRGSRHSSARVPSVRARTARRTRARRPADTAPG